MRISALEAEAAIAALVERAFEGLPPDAGYLPIIGGWPFLDCNRTKQKQTAVAALNAVRWAEFELPPWMLPLLLKAEDCVALFNGPHQGDRRSGLRGEYCLELRSMWWDIPRLRPFEMFCAGKLGG